MNTVSTPLYLVLVGINLLTVIVFLVTTKTPRSVLHISSGVLFVALCVILAIMALNR